MGGGEVGVAGIQRERYRPRLVNAPTSFMQEGTHVWEVKYEDLELSAILFDPSIPAAELGYVICPPSASDPVGHPQVLCATEEVRSLQACLGTVSGRPSSRLHCSQLSLTLLNLLNRSLASDKITKLSPASRWLKMSAVQQDVSKIFLGPLSVLRPKKQPN